MANDYQQKDGSGALFKPKQPKKSDKSPDYTGSITVGGKKYSLAAWIKKSKAGTTYMSVATGEWREQRAQSNAQPGGGESYSAETPFQDDDIPFVTKDGVF